MGFLTSSSADEPTLPLSSVNGSATTKATEPATMATKPIGRTNTASRTMSPPARSLGSCSFAGTACPTIAAVNAATTRLRFISLRIAFLHFGKLVEERIVTLSFHASNNGPITALLRLPVCFDPRSRGLAAAPPGAMHFGPCRRSVSPLGIKDMTQEQQLVWPTPPHHDYADAQAARASSDCLIALFDGRKLFGNILRFLPDGEVVEFRPMQNGKVLQVPFDEIKNLRLIRPVTFRSRDIKLAEKGTDVVEVSSNQKFTVEFRDGERLTGETRGFV